MLRNGIGIAPPVPAPFELADRVIVPASMLRPGDRVPRDGEVTKPRGDGEYESAE